MVSRRRFLQLAAGGPAVLLDLPNVALAQTYPARPVKLIEGFGAGGTPDIVARLIGQWLSERLGQPFIVENRPGAGSSIAAESVVRSPPDGYTLLTVTGANAVNATIYEKLSYNLVRDIIPIAGAVRVPLVMDVHPSTPVKTSLYWRSMPALPTTSPC